MDGKQFERWHVLKQSLHARNFFQYCAAGEIWVCAIGENIGREQNGKREMFQRPVFILKRFGNGTFLGIPLTSTVGFKKMFLQISGGSFLVLSQVRLWDTRRLIRNVRRVSAYEYEYVLLQFINFLKEN